MNKIVKIYCANCVFFDDRASQGRNFGKCIKYAPRAFREERDKSGFAKWPLVHVDEKCGEFELNQNLKEYADFSDSSS